jgi:acyl dehydratase
MSLNRDRLGAEYGPVRLTVDADRIAAYADATGDRLTLYRASDAVAPPVFGIVPAWPAVQQALADEELGVDVGRLVHGEQRMTFHRLIRAGDRLSTSGRLSSISERGENEVFVLTFETHDAARSLVTTQEVVCVSRGTATSKKARTDLRSVPAHTKTDARAPDVVRSVDIPLDITFRYARASGDDNRIHLDEDFARAMGLPGIIVHGMCLFSISLQTVIDAAAGARPDRLASAAVRFRKPIRPGVALTTRVYLNHGTVRFEGCDEEGEVVQTGTAAIADKPRRTG